MLKIIFIVDNLACTENQTNMVPHVCSRIIRVREGCACWARGKGKENQFKVDSTLETKPWVTGDSEKYGFSSLFFSVSFRLWPRFPGPLGFFSHCLCLDLPTAPCAVWLSTNKQHGFLPSLSSCTQLLRLQFACPGAFPLNFSKIILKLKKKKKSSGHPWLHSTAWDTSENKKQNPALLIRRHISSQTIVSQKLLHVKLPRPDSLTQSPESIA